MGKIKIISAAVIAAGLCGLGAFVKGGFDNFSYRDRAVTVKGLAEREVKANKVTWPVVYEGNAKDMPTLYRDLKTNTDKIVQYLEGNGLTPEEISVSAPDVSINKNYNTGAINSYSVKSVVVVSSSNVDLVTSLIQRQAELLNMGIVVTSDWSNRITYEYTDLNAIKPEMVAEATANARLAANKFADDSQSKLGKIKSASQGQFSIEDRDQYTPYLKRIRVVSSITYYIED